MTRITCAGAVVAALLATGCIQSSTLIKVKADGSGTIEQEMLAGGGMMSMMEGMAGENRESGEMFDEESMRRAGEKLGEGVRFVSHEPIERSGMKGARAVFAFDDINAVKVRETPDFPGAGGDEAGAIEPEFTLTLERRGSGRVLTIATPEPKAGEGEMPGEVPEMPDVPEAIPPEAMGMMKMMFQNLKVGVAVEVDGEIVRTNAQHREGSRVTIVEVDFNELMKDEASFKAIQGKIGPGAAPSDLRDTLKNLKGVKVNTDRVITIEWKEGPA